MQSDMTKGYSVAGRKKVIVRPVDSDRDIEQLVAFHVRNMPHADANFDGWYKEPFRKRGKTTWEELSPWQRYMHGGSWVDIGYCREHIKWYGRRGNLCFIAETTATVGKANIVGHMELWLADEPQPIGRNVGIEILALSPESLDVENVLLDHAVEVSSQLGYPSLTICPETAGGTPARLLERGFREIWRTVKLSFDSNEVPKPLCRFEVETLQGDYERVANLLCLNHREPPAFHWENIWNTNQGSLKKALGKVEKRFARIVSLSCPPGDASVKAALTVWRRAFIGPAWSQLDLWVDPRHAADSKIIADLIRISSQICRNQNILSFGVPVPAGLEDGLRKEGLTIRSRDGYGSGKGEPRLIWRRAV